MRRLVTLVPIALGGAILVATPATPAADADGHYAVLGVGRASCHGYLGARETPQHDKFKGYVAGFVTAYNTLAPDTYSVTGARNVEELMDLVATHCKQHKMDSFERALQQMVANLAATRERSAPRSTGGWGRQ